MLVDIWRVVRYRNPGDREDSFKEYFLAQEEATQVGEDFIVEAGICHTGKRNYPKGIFSISKNIKYHVRLDK